MKWESSDLTVGAVVVAAVVIFLGSFLWLSPAVSARTYPLFTELDRIDGVSRQGNVVLGGYTIGSVGDIEPRMTEDGTLSFRVRLDIQARLASGDSLRLPTGTTARLVPPPVIGAGYIVLEPPAEGGPPLQPGATIPGFRATAIVEQMQGITDDVSVEVMHTMTTARSLMDSLTAAVVVANRTLTETASVIPPLVGGLERQLAAAEALTNELRGHLGALTPAALASIDSAAVLLSDSRRLVNDLNDMVRTTTPEMRHILANLDTTSILLTHFVRQVSARPWKAFTGVEPPAGLEPPPPGPAISADEPVGADSVIGGPLGSTVLSPETDSLPRP